MINNNDFHINTQYLYESFIASEISRVINAFKIHKKLYSESQNRETLQYFNTENYNQLQTINHAIFGIFDAGTTINNYNNNIIIQSNCVDYSKKKLNNKKTIALSVDVFFKYKNKKCNSLFKSYHDAVIFSHLNYELNRKVFKFKSVSYFDVYAYIYKYRNFDAFKENCKKIECNGSDIHPKKIQKSTVFAERFLIT